MVLSTRLILLRDSFRNKLLRNNILERSQIQLVNNEYWLKLMKTQV